MGVEIQPGDYVAYGVREDNTGGLRVGVVLEVDRKTAKVRGCEPSWGKDRPFDFARVCGRLTKGSRVIRLHPAQVRREIIDGLGGPTKKETEA